jgi:glycosyltransferase involved in cell wall biosynthesis
LPVDSELELTVVIPCLNEADTLGECVRRAAAGITAGGGTGEVVVADNGSTDGSPEIARAAGARVIEVIRRGYGEALMAGIAAARGRFIVMGDADLSYDFATIPDFLAELRKGYELVQGCRLPAGGGAVRPGAMPSLHRWFGNPALTRIARLLFRTPVHDVYCGLRGFTKALYLRLDQQCGGMEFATEMIIKASLHRARITEIPVTLHPDGRVSHAPHLRTFRDGWRTLRLFLIYSPQWLFLLPGLLLIVLGLGAYALALPALQFRGITFDAHTLLFGSLFVLCGYQAVWFSIFTKTLAVNEGMHPPSAWLNRFYGVATLERGLALSVLAMAAGAVLLVIAINNWREAGFGPLDYGVTRRLVVPGATVVALAFQTCVSSFLVSILSLQRVRRP